MLSMDLYLVGITKLMFIATYQAVQPMLYEELHLKF